MPVSMNCIRLSPYLCYLKKFNFSQKKIDQLKVKAAEFLAQKFEMIHNNPGMAVMLPRVTRQQKDLTRWKLPNLFGGTVVTHRVLPLGFTSAERPPNPEK